MKSIKAIVLLVACCTTNSLMPSHHTNNSYEVRCYIEFPKDATKSAQWRNYYGDAIIEATTDGRFIYPINENTYAHWKEKLDAQDFIQLPVGYAPQTFDTKEEYRDFLIAHCCDHKHVQDALAYETKIDSLAIETKLQHQTILR